jgi:hypothetical protein
VTRWIAEFRQNPTGAGVSAAETLEYPGGEKLPYGTFGAGTRGKLRWLPTDQLFVPEEYQRSLIASHA